MKSVHYRFRQNIFSFIHSPDYKKLTDNVVKVDFQFLAKRTQHFRL